MMYYKIVCIVLTVQVYVFLCNFFIKKYLFVLMSHSKNICLWYLVYGARNQLIFKIIYNKIPLLSMNTLFRLSNSKREILAILHSFHLSRYRKNFTNEKKKQVNDRLKRPLLQLLSHSNVIFHFLNSLFYINPLISDYISEYY